MAMQYLEYIVTLVLCATFHNEIHRYIRRLYIIRYILRVRALGPLSCAESQSTPVSHLWLEYLLNSSIETIEY
jgi:hypothetical protein